MQVLIRMGDGGKSTHKECFCVVSVGNVPGASDDFDKNCVAAVQTRSFKSKPIHPLKVEKLDAINVTPTDFLELQQSCHSLEKVRKLATKGETIRVREGSTYMYTMQDGLLYRKCIDS